jgi:DNA-binding response OmpR family regulator
MITGQSGNEDKLHAYKGGADDYLVKPFKLEELVAKIQAWLKRRHDFLSSEVGSTILTVADLRLNLLRRCAIRGGREFPLTSKECAILEYLMRNKGQIKSQTAILEHISNVDYDPLTNTIEVHIKHLREKIDAGFDKQLIKTVRGSGYVIDDPSAANP